MSQALSIVSVHLTLWALFFSNLVDFISCELVLFCCWLPHVPYPQELRYSILMGRGGYCLDNSQLKSEHNDLPTALHSSTEIIRLN